MYTCHQVENEKTTLLTTCEEKEEEVEAITAENAEEIKRIGELEVCIITISITSDSVSVSVLLSLGFPQFLQSVLRNCSVHK